MIVTVIKIRASIRKSCHRIFY